MSEYAGRCGPEVMELDVTPYGINLRVPSHLPISITMPYGLDVEQVRYYTKMLVHTLGLERKNNKI